MKSDREKLIELLLKGEDAVPCYRNPDYDCDGIKYPSCERAAMADFLISHGVRLETKQAISDKTSDSKWISVHERLPDIPEGWLENPNPVFFVVKGQDTIEAGYYGEHGTWRDRYFRTYRNGYEGYDADDVLCWMWQSSLPLPPREE